MARPTRRPAGSTDAELGAWLAEQARARGVPGLAAALLSRGAPPRLLAAGVADVATGRAVTPATRFAWYSLTKVVTAAAVLRQVERGRLALQTPAVDLVPELARTDPARPWPAPDLGDLLAHGSGLADRQVRALGWMRPPGAPWPEPRAFLARALARHGPRRRPPGARLRYGNLGYGVLGEVLATVTGRPFREHVVTDVLAPLGLARTGFARDDEGPERQATGHLRPCSTMGVATRWLGGRAFLDGRAGRWRHYRWHDLVVSPHGGLLGPLDELARLLQAFVEGGSLDGATLLERATLERMTERHLGGGWRRRAPTGMALGWRRDEAGVAGVGAPVLSHGGRGPGFTSTMRWVPARGRAVAVLGNGGFDARAVADALLRAAR